jgi:fucose permease
MATAGGAALARLIGPVIDFFNVQSAGLGYQVMLAVCFVYFVAGALLLLKIKDQHNRRSAVQHPTPTQQSTSG